jgi:hypothetical protein
MNVLMNPHSGLEEQEDPLQGQKLIHHANTRISEVKGSSGSTPAPSQEAISRTHRADTPKVKGYSFVSTPKPSELGTSKMTCGSISSTLIPIESTLPSSFHFAELSEREKIARKLAGKAQKDITARQKAYTPHLRHMTKLGQPKQVGSEKEIPKFASSPDVSLWPIREHRVDLVNCFI